MSGTSYSVGRATEIARAVDERRPTITPADLVLLVIAGLLAFGVTLALVSGLSVSTALFAVCLPALGTIGYAIFFAPPVSTEED